MLQDQTDMKIICEASNGAEAVDKVREHRPDIVLLDIAMPVMNGILAARLIRSASPSSKILMLTQFDSKALMKAAFAAGASGFLVKTDAGQHLIPELRKLQI
jgi:DNA-binding NarL/FixJ family response regulator